MAAHPTNNYQALPVPGQHERLENAHHRINRSLLRRGLPPRPVQVVWRGGTYRRPAIPAAPGQETP